MTNATPGISPFIHNIKQDSTIQDYISLLKPRVMSLVVFTAISGIILAPGKIHLFTAFTSILFTSLGAGSAACLNMWYDRDIDTLMERTKKRAIVRGAVDESDALAMGIFLAVISVIGMMVCVNLLSGLLLLASISFYIFIYTMWLKRSTTQNIVIGGAAGAFPPLIGWASCTNSLNLDSMILFLIIFLWTPAHFWALALYKSEDYRAANIPMLPVVKGREVTKNQILLYTVLMTISCALPYLTGLCGIFYLFTSSFMSGYFILAATDLKYEKGINSAPKLFAFSIIYLFVIFGLMMIGKNY
ncbi:MAG: heme o synthase [Rickettsiaceae bacterium]|nr:heme o synthase [Rickettsiaceae bacterium]